MSKWAALFLFAALASALVAYTGDSAATGVAHLLFYGFLVATAVAFLLTALPRRREQ